MSHQLCRRKMAPELEACAFDRRKCRKAAFDSEGRDVRMITFGMKWQAIRERKEETLSDFTARVQKAFDEAYEKITGGKRTSLDSHLLPTIKTPAIRKTRARLNQEEEQMEWAEQGVEPGPTITMLAFEDDSPANDEQGVVEPAVIQDVTNTSSARATRSTSKKTSLMPKGDESENNDVPTTTKRTTRRAGARGGVSTVQGGGVPSGKESCSEETIPDTTASTCRTRARTARKVKQRRATGGESQENANDDTREDGLDLPEVQEAMESSTATVRRSTRTRARTAQVTATGKKSLEDFMEESVRRSTRARRAKGDTQTDTGEEIVPSTTTKRTTRARTRQQVVEEEKSKESGKEEGVTSSEPDKTDAITQDVEKESRHSIRTVSQVLVERLSSSLLPSPTSDSSQSALVEKKAVSSEPDSADPTLQAVENENRQSIRTVSQVLVERLSTSLLPSPTSDPSPPPAVEEEDGRNVVSETILQCPGSPAEIPSDLKQGSVLGGKRSSQSTVNVCPETSDSESEAYMKPPPPKRSLRLKKKGGRPRKGRGGKKGGHQAASTASTLQDEPKVETQPEDESVTAEVSVSVEKVAEQREDADSEEVREPPDVTKKDTIPQANSAESMYESCVSDIESTSPLTASMLTPPQSTTQPSTDTAATVTKISRAPATDSNTPVTPAVGLKSKPVGSATVTKTPKIKTRKTPLGMTSTKDHPVLSPLSVPYLHEAPRSLQQLQGSHQPGGSPGSGRVISISELRANHSRVPTPKTITKPHPLQQRSTPYKSPRAGAKRLRSVSLERLPTNLSPPKKELVVTASSSGEEEGGEEFLSPLATSSSDDVETDETPDEGGFSSAEKTASDSESVGNQGEGSTVTKSKSSKAAAFWHLFQKKGGEGVVSKFAIVGMNANLPSFLPRNSPKKQDTFEFRHVKLAEKVQRKNEEEDKRRRELEQKKQQDLAEKIRKREERIKRVAEKQATLQREETEKKKRAHGLKSRDDEIKKQRIIEKKVKEMEERNKKAKERKEAVDSRRKQEEEQRLKRFQQIEEERRMAEELLKKRQEQEEEEKRLRRQEKQKQDLERQEQEQRKKREEEAERLQPEDTSPPQQDEDTWNPPQKGNLDKKRFEKLLISQQKGAGGNRFVQQWKQLNATPGKSTAAAALPKNKGTVTKSKPASHFSMVSDDGAHGPSPMDIHATAAGSVSSQKLLNSTITKDDVVYQTPVKTLNSKYTTAPSYEMTPAEVQDPLLAYSNYDITELSDEDSTDDEDQPKKPVPLWAHPQILNKWMVVQEDTRKFDVSQIFPPDQLLQMPDLAKIFKVKRRRFYQRSSSAQWDSPMLKKSRHDCHL